MKTCAICNRYSAFIEDGICNKCHKRQKTHDIKFKPSGRMLMPTTKEGFIITLEAWTTISAKVNRYYQTISNDEIYEHNAEIKENLVKRESNPQLGYIYLLKSSNGYCKIGRTKSLNNRIKNIERQYPVDIKIINYFQVTDMAKIESSLHRYFSEYCIQNGREWFSLNEKQIDFLLSFDSDKLYETEDILKLLA